MSFAWLQIAIDSSRILIKPQNADFRLAIFQNSEHFEQIAKVERQPASSRMRLGGQNARPKPPEFWPGRSRLQSGVRMRLLKFTLQNVKQISFCPIF
jgi:hypothetical protein